MFDICKNIKLTLSLALFALLLVTVSVSCQAEGSYKLTEMQLNDMKHYINVIKQEKQNLLNDLQNCKISLKQAEERRQNLENQLNEALTKLTLLQSERSELETLSKELKEQFEISKREAESRIKKLTIQRNLSAIVAIIAAIFAF